VAITAPLHPYGDNGALTGYARESPEGLRPRNPPTLPYPRAPLFSLLRSAIARSHTPHRRETAGALLSRPPLSSPLARRHVPVPLSEAPAAAQGYVTTVCVLRGSERHAERREPFSATTVLGSLKNGTASEQRSERRKRGLYPRSTLPRTSAVLQSQP